MPFTLLSPNLPSNVKKLSSNAKKRWINTFNSVHSQCTRDKGGDCEGKAFRVANGSIKRESDMVNEQAQNGVYRFRQSDPKNFIRFRIREVRPGLKMVIGFKKGGGSETQSVLFDRNKFTMAQAKKWLEDNKMKSGTMESNKVLDESKNNEITIKESSIEEVHPIQILESFDETEKGEKRVLVVNFLREGPGNKAHNNYYLRGAVESVKNHLDTTRKKMFINHSTEPMGFDRDLRDWASSVMETWIEEKNGKAILNGKVKVFDNWLWERAKQAPSELSLSIEGRGVAKPQTIENNKFNAVSEITHLNCVSWVDYPGNASMGVSILEKEKKKMDSNEKKSEEDLKMDLTKITEADIQKLKEERPELFSESFVDSSEEVSKLQKAFEEFKLNSEKSNELLKEKIDVLEADKTKLSNLVESHEIKAKDQEKRALVEKLLSESKLTDETKTETFKNALFALKEKKIGDKTLTVEEQAKELIADREKVCVVEVAKANVDGDKNTNQLSEAEKSAKFAKNFFGYEEPKKDEK